MTTRDDITVLYHLNPRLILVAQPSNEVTMQDLHDTLMDIDDEPANMSYPHLVESAGKEDLGGGVKVGITLTLQNAQIAFERRETVKTNGTITTDSVTGSLTQQLIDSSATFITDGIERGDLVSNSTDISACEVIEVLSETELLVLSPGAGITSDFTTGDNYQIWETETCNFSGGNLVAVDTTGNTIEALFPTYCVTAKVTASSAATLQNTAQLEYSTFSGGVHVNLSSSYSGTNYPVGTPQEPVNNFSDALNIMATRGFTRMYVYGSATIDSGLDYSGLEIIGESPNKTTFTITSAADVTNSEFSHATVTGTLDGGNVLTDCSCLTLNYVDGIIQRCLLLETITLSGADIAFFLDCWSGVPGADDTPTIDMGGSGSELAVRNYSGGLRIRNRNGTDPVSIDLASGQIIIDETVTAGTITLRGVGKWTNEETYAGGATINSELITATDTQHIGFENGVWIDEIAGVTGAAHPRGSHRLPINNWDDALVIASGHHMETVYVLGDTTIPSGVDVSQFTIIGENAAQTEIDVEAGSIVANTEFQECLLSGTLGPQSIVRNAIVSSIDNFTGVLHQTMLLGTVTLSPIGFTAILDCFAGSETWATPTLDCNGVNIDAVIRNYRGKLQVTNATGAAQINVEGVGELIIDDSCTGGTAILRGVGNWGNEDTYAGTTVVSNRLLQTNPDVNVIQVSGVPVSIEDFRGVGTEINANVIKVNGKDVSILPPGDIADAVWDEGVSDHQVIGTAGYALNVASGILMGQGATGAGLSGIPSISNVDTVTNLTNLPTMPTDWVTADGLSAGAVSEIQSGLATPTNITAGTITNITNFPSGDVAYAVWDEPLSDHQVAGTAGNALSVASGVSSESDPTAIASAVWNNVMDAGYTADETMKIMLAALAGKLSGAAGTTITIRDVNDTKDRIVAQVDEDGNRLSVTLDGS